MKDMSETAEETSSSGPENDVKSEHALHQGGASQLLRTPERPRPSTARRAVWIRQHCGFSWARRVLNTRHNSIVTCAHELVCPISSSPLVKASCRARRGVASVTTVKKSDTTYSGTFQEVTLHTHNSSDHSNTGVGLSQHQVLGGFDVLLHAMLGKTFRVMRRW